MAELDFLGQGDIDGAVTQSDVNFSPLVKRGEGGDHVVVEIEQNGFVKPRDSPSL